MLGGQQGRAAGSQLGKRLRHVEVGENAGLDFASVLRHQLVGQPNRVLLHADIFKGVIQFVISLLAAAGCENGRSFSLEEAPGPAG